MSYDQGKKIKPEQQTLTTELQKIRSTELADADLDKVAAGADIKQTQTTVAQTQQAKTTGGVPK
jgi:hypothetical protein